MSSHDDNWSLGGEESEKKSFESSHTQDEEEEEDIPSLSLSTMTSALSLDSPADSAVKARRDQNKQAAKRYREKKKREVQHLEKLQLANARLKLDVMRTDSENEERQRVLDSLRQENQKLEQELQAKRSQNRRTREDCMLFRNRLESVVSNMGDDEQASHAKALLEALLQRS